MILFCSERGGNGTLIFYDCVKEIFICPAEPFVEIELISDISDK